MIILIKEKRKLLGYTQEKMAEILKISLRQYVRIDTEEDLPRRDILKELIRILNLSNEEIAYFNFCNENLFNQYFCWCYDSWYNFCVSVVRYICLAVSILILWKNMGKKVKEMHQNNSADITQETF